MPEWRDNDRAEDAGPAPPTFAHTSRYGRDTRAVIDGDWKLIERFEPARTIRWLFDWRADPLERADLKEANPVRAEVLRVAIERELARGRPLEVEEAVLDEQVREDLRALGYLE